MDKNIERKILNRLPYSEPFRFVDTLEEINDNFIRGAYCFKKDAFFYRGHFINNPVTPGVILVEAMGQAGLVCFGIYLLGLHENNHPYFSVLTHFESEFHKMVLPEERVIITAEKQYLRNNILKSRIRMENSNKELVATTIGSCKFNLGSI
ncbi:MAG: hydroxymyristoyl-ACP dehydratase [Bacteroidia bacterium]|nr:hydroxymyristoyl-ACP dehydratase [Bacteroidia bacterium]